MSDLVERLAREGGCDLLGKPGSRPDADGLAPDHWLRRFAELVAQHCAKEAEDWCYGIDAATAIRAKFKAPE